VSPARMSGRDALAVVHQVRGERDVVVTTMATSRDWMTMPQRPLDIVFVPSAMGHATSLGLGLALAQPQRRVLVITGDGEILMGLGSLATVGVQSPPNLTVAVLDNGHYAETGMQSSHTSHGTNLQAVAAGCGIGTALEIRTMQQVEALRGLLHRGAGPVFASIRVSPEEDPRVLPPRDGVFLKLRFREQLGFKSL